MLLSLLICLFAAELREAGVAATSGEAWSACDLPQQLSTSMWPSSSGTSSSLHIPLGGPCWPTGAAAAASTVVACVCEGGCCWQEVDGEEVLPLLLLSRGSMGCRGHSPGPEMGRTKTIPAAPLLLLRAHSCQFFGSHWSSLSCCAANSSPPGLLYTHSTMGDNSWVCPSAPSPSRVRCSARHFTMEGTAWATQLCTGSLL
mmetsp:Transcript_20891/g.58161  ORF Transcript_20891/g.58161 Transcript_20891/m.58161 type:complete len:201 (+) Transcript_20891:1306-1908(+)